MFNLNTKSLIFSTVVLHAYDPTLIHMHLHMYMCITHVFVRATQLKCNIIENIGTFNMEQVSAIYGCSNRMNCSHSHWTTFNHSSIHPSIHWSNHQITRKCVIVHILQVLYKEDDSLRERSFDIFNLTQTPIYPTTQRHIHPFLL